MPSSEPPTASTPPSSDKAMHFRGQSARGVSYKKSGLGVVNSSSPMISQLSILPFHWYVVTIRSALSYSAAVPDDDQTSIEPTASISPFPESAT
jgi:hypothetical protein